MDAARLSLLKEERPASPVVVVLDWQAARLKRVERMKRCEQNRRISS
jgi:hypothetical protein